MLWLYIIAAIWLWCIAAAPAPAQYRFTSHVESPRAVFRDLRTDDIPAITRVFVDAFAPGELYHYLAPDLQGHEEELARCMEVKIAQLWKARDRETTFGKVVAVGDEDVPVSFSIWNIRTHAARGARSWTTQTGLVSMVKECTTLPGVNMTRAIDYDKQEAAIIHREIDTAYPRQLYLNLLATHPRWDGHGFAARHLRWGKHKSHELPGKLQAATAARWPVTLLATPAGYPLYSAEGFESVRNVTIYMLDGLGTLWYESMRWSE